MPSLASSSKKASFSNKHLYTAGVIVLVIGILIFLPELTSMKGGQGEEEELASEYYIEEEVEETSVEQVKYQEQPAPFDTFSSENNAPEIVVTWDSFTERANLRNLKKAVKTMKKLEMSLKADVRGKESLAILKNYSEIIQYIMKKGEDSYPTPEKAYSDVITNEKLLTRALVKEKVDRASRILWSQVDLGQGLQSQQSLSEKKRIIGPFRPDPRLQKLQIVQSSNSDSYDPTRPLQIRIDGVIRGNDVASIELVPRSTITSAQRVKLRRTTDLLGQRRFTVRAAQPPTDETFILRVTDIRGDTYLKRYKFYPRVTKFTWLGIRERGRFAIPYREGDPRLDKYFRVTREQSERTPIRRSSFFGGTEGTRF